MAHARSDMDCSSDESSELSDTDIDDYADNSYTDLKAGKLVARLGVDRFRCPFCPGKKKQDYRYSEILQHAVGVGASNRAAKVKANHRALAKLLKEDHADAAGTLPPRQAAALTNPPKPAKDQEIFVWPWMGVIKNVPAEQTQKGGAILLQQLAEFKPVKFNALYCANGYTGVVGFSKDWIGFKNALAFQNHFKSKHLGKMDWKESSQKGNHMYGWLAQEEDYKSGDPVGLFLAENGVLKTISDLQKEMSSKTDSLIADLAKQIRAKSVYLQELEFKCSQMNLSVQRAAQERDLLDKRFNDEMRHMESAAREDAQRVLQENDQLRKQLEENERNIQRRSKELSELAAQTDMERRKLEMEKRKNADQNNLLNMARIEQQKADEKMLRLLEKQEKEKDAALKKIRQLERQLDEKQQLELAIEQLKGKLEVVKYMEGEGVDVKKRTEELTAELNEKIEEMEELETLNQTLVVKDRMANDELQDAKKELIEGLEDMLGPRSNIQIKRMGELDEKPFVEACEQMYGVDADLKAAEFISLWQENLKDANWHPFKIVTTGSTVEQTIDENDEKLVSLKEQLGEQVYRAVTTAVREINEYNASGSYVVRELWNKKQNRKASITEAIEHLMKLWEAKKRRR